MGSIPESGIFPGEGNGNPLQYSCLENPMDGRSWRATVHGIAKSRHNWATSLSLYVLSVGWEVRKRIKKASWRRCCLSWFLRVQYEQIILKRGEKEIESTNNKQHMNVNRHEGDGRKWHGTKQRDGDSGFRFSWDHIGVIWKVNMKIWSCAASGINIAGLGLW